jgi:hypothetical protein
MSYFFLKIIRVNTKERHAWHVLMEIRKKIIFAYNGILCFTIKIIDLNMANKCYYMMAHVHAFGHIFVYPEV